MTKEEYKADFGDLTDKNLGQLKVLNTAIFPVKYNDKFYTDLLLPGREELTKLGMFIFHIIFSITMITKKMSRTPYNRAHI